MKRILLGILFAQALYYIANGLSYSSDLSVNQEIFVLSIVVLTFIGVLWRTIKARNAGTKDRGSIRILLLAFLLLYVVDVLLLKLSLIGKIGTMLGFVISIVTLLSMKKSSKQDTSTPPKRPTPVSEPEPEPVDGEEVQGSVFPIHRSVGIQVNGPEDNRAEPARTFKEVKTLAYYNIRTHSELNKVETEIEQDYLWAYVHDVGSAWEVWIEGKHYPSHCGTEQEAFDLIERVKTGEAKCSFQFYTPPNKINHLEDRYSE